jgi:hypothetical protein
MRCLEVIGILEILERVCSERCLRSRLSWVIGTIGDCEGC